MKPQHKLEALIWVLLMVLLCIGYAAYYGQAG